MTARVTADEVREVIDTSLTDDVICGSMIDTASLIVDTNLLTSGLPTAVLRKIELYLAAHFVALTEERGAITHTKIGDASESLANIYGEGFRATRFGQTALALDSTGTLTKVAQTRLKAEMRVV